MKLKVLRWPYPYRWAFSFTSDTDNTSLAATQFFYQYCLEHHLYPTKTVWAHRPQRTSGSLKVIEPDHSPTLEDLAYKQYCQDIKHQGIEFCLHDASAGDNTRTEILEAFESFQQTFGDYPRMHICHSHNQDHPYWGENHFRHPLLKSLAKLLYGKKEFSGEKPDSPYYWSDICRRYIDYIRMFRVLDFNVLKYNPSMPYHLYDKPDVKYWFSVSGGGHYLLNNLVKNNLDQLAQEDGAFILYGYEGEFSEVDANGARHFKKNIRDALDLIAERQDCWKANTSTILDRSLVIKNLIVTRQNHAVILSNPTPIDLSDLQLSINKKSIWLSPQEQILPDAQGIYHLKELKAGACLALFYSSEESEVGDTVGIPFWEILRMLFEEGKHLFWKRLIRKIW